MYVPKNIIKEIIETMIKVKFESAYKYFDFKK